MASDVNIIEEGIDTYLSFRLKEEVFALEIAYVIEIIEIPGITLIPKAPRYMKGVINLRGKVIPVIDAGIKFGLDPIEPTVDSCIIIMQLKTKDMDLEFGIIVDQVLEVFEYSRSSLQASPQVDSEYNLDYIKGISQIDESFVMVINIDKAFSAGEIQLKKDVRKKSNKKPNTKKS